MDSSNTQYMDSITEVINDQIIIYGKTRKIYPKSSIPDTTEIPIEDPCLWLKISGIVCVLVDMKGSTKLSAANHDASTAGAYQLFTGTAVKIFNQFDAPYIDVKGDGVFALFNNNQVYRAFAAAVTFKTFSKMEFEPRIERDTEMKIGAHIGIDQRTVLVRKIGYKRHGGRTDRQNEVWAGKPVNVASKLASLGAKDEMVVSDRYFSKITNELVRKSCGCPSGTKVNLWTEIDLANDEKFDFDKAYKLSSQWCQVHGKEYCEKILQLD
jgi:class 3 adenylate cyclase